MPDALMMVRWMYVVMMIEMMIEIIGYEGRKSGDYYGEIWLDPITYEGKGRKSGDYYGERKLALWAFFGIASTGSSTALYMKIFAITPQKAIPMPPQFQRGCPGWPPSASRLIAMPGTTQITFPGPEPPWTLCRILCRRPLSITEC